MNRIPRRELINMSIRTFWTGRLYWTYVLLLLCVSNVQAEVATSFGAGPDAWTGDLSAITSQEWSRDRAAHLLERAGFGGTPEDVAATKASYTGEFLKLILSKNTAKIAAE